MRAALATAEGTPEIAGGGIQARCSSAFWVTSIISSSREPENSQGWQGALEIIWSNPSLGNSFKCLSTLTVQAGQAPPVPPQQHYSQRSPGCCRPFHSGSTLSAHGPLGVHQALAAELAAPSMSWCTGLFFPRCRTQHFTL